MQAKVLNGLAYIADPEFLTGTRRVLDQPLLKVTVLNSTCFADSAT
jgi:hypothetical protein